VVLDNVGTRENCLPDQRGGTNFMPPSFDPTRRLFFVTARETGVTWVSTKPTSITLGDRVPSGGPKHLDDGPPQYSALRAIDPVNGAVRWEHRFRGYPSEMVLDLSGGAMTTASGLVFTATTTATCMRSTPPPGTSCGASRQALRSGAWLPSPICWTAPNGSWSPPG
jgi:hypothetical protein